MLQEANDLHARGRGDAVFYIRKARRLSVVSKTGRKPLGMREVRWSLVACGGPALAAVVFGYLQKAMVLALHREHTFSDLFVAYLLAGTFVMKKMGDLRCPGKW